MRRKGFTILEVLGVMVILSVLVLVIYPVISESIWKGKQDALKVNVNVIEKATENWLNVNAGMLPEEGEFTLYLIDLKANGLIDKDIKNPETGKKFPDDMEITVRYDDRYGKYTPDVDITTGSEEDEEIDEERIVLLLKSTKVEYIEINSEYNLKYRSEDIIAKDAQGRDINPADIKITYHRYLNDVINEPEGFKEKITYPEEVKLDTSDFYKYKVTYEATNSKGVTSKAIRTIVVRDTTPPVINVPANARISKYQSSFNVEDGISYSDNSCEHKGCSVVSMNTGEDGDIVVSRYGNVTLGRVGEYTITYVAKDRSGNTSKKTRTISVVDEKCPTIVIKGTTPSNEATNNKSVTLKAQLSKVATYIDEQGRVMPSSIQWYRKDGDEWKIIPGATDASYETKDYFGASYMVTAETNNLVCNSLKNGEGYNTFIHLPKFECSVEGITGNWVKEANLKVKLQVIDEGGRYKVASDDANAGNWKTLTETFKVNQHKKYTINAYNKYKQEAIDYNEPQKQEVQCSVGPTASTYNKNAGTGVKVHQQILVDDDDPNITINIYNQNTGGLVESKKNGNISKGWVNYRYKIVVNVDDKRNKSGDDNGKELSGIKEFKVNGALQNSNTYTVPIAPEGTTTYTFYVKDGVGRERTQTLTIKSDTTPPTCGTNDGTTSWTKSDRTVTTQCVETANEQNSGCSKPSFATTYTATTKTSSIQITDNVGNAKDCPVNVYVDKTAPTCSLRVDGTLGSNGWYRDTAKVSVASEYDEHSGVKSTLLNSNNEREETFGETEVSGVVKTATVTDNVLNTNSCQASAKVDASDPNLTIALYNQKTGGHVGTWTNQDVNMQTLVGYRYKVVVTTSDARSGVRALYVNNSKQSSTSYTISQTPEGKPTYTFKVEDNVGRTRTQTLTLRSDTTPPACGSSGGGSTSWTKDSRTISVECVEDQTELTSGCASSSYSTTFTDSQRVGNIRIADKLGNARNCAVNVYIDKTPPSCNISVNGSMGNNGWYTSNVTVEAKGYDDVSGIASQKLANGSTTWVVENTNGFGTTATIQDGAGNVSTCSVSGIRVDTIAPTCAPQVSNHGGTTGINSAFGCSDNAGGSGVAYCPGTVLGVTSPWANEFVFEVGDYAGHRGFCRFTVYPEQQYNKRSCNQSTCHKCEAAGCARHTACKNGSCKRWNQKDVCNTTYTYESRLASDCSNQVANSKCGMSENSDNRCCKIAHTSCHKENTSCAEYNKVEDSSCPCAEWNSNCKKCGCSSWDGWQGWRNSPYSCSSLNCQTDSRTVYYCTNIQAY